ncbi:sensor domain-containing diguanylate cyclase [Pseudoalteromonas sp. SWXJZ10B]|uniref:sensor domain-containing diguanylate cyclase n=1 Tax=Pseudoalteromonas sp. SWXJZ10B TaxID=2792063 RepID=UPI0018CD5B8A|nr:diguanylate cyclase [Pseudoalteromonas sp. SWXJZ10B]MBH0043722.1 diguanylate cyclase [Pseudoalteromonas sp. SWXJZ10B]
MACAKALLSLLMLLCTFCSFASPVIIKHDFNSQDINNLHYSFEPTSLLDAQQSSHIQWQKNTGKPLNLGLEQRSVWMKFKIKNTLSYDTEQLLSLNNPLLNDVQVYQLHNSQLISHTQIGDGYPLNKRAIKSESLLVKLISPANSETIMIMRVTNSSGLRVPLTLWQPEAYLAHKGKLNLLYGLLIGFIFSLGVSCLVLYSFSRKRYFVYAGLITLTLGSLLAYICGFGLKYIHPNLPVLQQVMIPILLMLIALMFLPLQKQICHPKPSFLLTVQKVIVNALGVSLLSIWLFPTHIVTLFCLTTIPIVLGFYIATTLMCIRLSPSKPNKALLLVLVFFLVVMLYFIVAVIGLYAFDRSTLAFVFTCFFSCTFCLCYSVMKLFILQRDEEVIAQQTLIAENAAQDTLLKERLKLQEKTRQELESQVDERTFELQVTLRELEEKNRSLELLNTEDALTGIKNRRFFDKKLIMEIRRSRREQTPLSIVMLDIDRFKSINDTYGHIIGDQVIKAVSDLIKDHLKRPLDEVARYGGEEFVVLLPNTPSEGAQDIAEKIRAAISASTVTVANNDIQFTISAGVYTSIADDVSSPQIFTECADKALYYAKQHGRNQVITFPLPQ